MIASKQKLYCYVDETGQDPGFDFFIAVAVVSDDNQERVRSALLDIERAAKVGIRKWHKSRLDRSLLYLRLAIERNVCKGDVNFYSLRKPIPYFLPLLEVIERSIARRARQPYRAIVYVDGIDRKKAVELTNALRAHGVSVDLVKSRRDESEPFIRLADRWAGCLRAGESEARTLCERAIRHGYLVDTTQNPR